MDIEIIAIGNEILSGFTINSNAAFISQHLAKRGIKTARHTVIPDDIESIKSELQEALDRGSIVITTGGLGPTCDDLTRKAAAELFHSTFIYKKEIEEHINNLYGKSVSSAQDQATVPQKAELMWNYLGTAPGFIFKNEKSTLFMLPGVPIEMKEMFIRDVVPRILSSVPESERLHTEWIYFTELFESQVDPSLREIEKEIPNIEVGIFAHLGGLAIQFSSKEKGPAIEAANALRKLFGKFEYHAESGKIEEAIHELMISRHQTLATAESCTGGSIASTPHTPSGRLEIFPW
jgi:nicotinamide-nucleotide amidase